MLRGAVVCLVIAIAASACGTPQPIVSSSPTAAADARALAYLDAAIDWIQANALFGGSLDWATVRERAHRVAEGASTPAETYDAIRYVLYQLADRHSRFIDPATAAAMAAGDLNYFDPATKRIDPSIGYIELPAFSGDPPLATTYATTAQRQIASVDGPGVCGWIVDLRTNQGGNMWAMLAGVGPILGEDKRVGSFVSANGHAVDWSYAGGVAAVDGFVLVTVDPPYTLRRTLPPVAVLTGGQTASAGEAIAIAFRGRASSRSFGEPTAGVPTMNAGMTLSDGAVIALTVSWMADRTGQTYGSRITADEDMSLAEDVVDAATAWLHQQPACRS